LGFLGYSSFENVRFRKRNKRRKFIFLGDRVKILKENSSPKNLKNLPPKWQKFNNFLGKAQQHNFDQSIIERKNALNETKVQEEEIEIECEEQSKGVRVQSNNTNNNYIPYKRQRTDESVSSRYLCLPRLDKDNDFYYLSLKIFL
jgi:hypothetical protein